MQGYARLISFSATSATCLPVNQCSFLFGQCSDTVAFALNFSISSKIHLQKCDTVCCLIALKGNQSSQNRKTLNNYFTTLYTAPCLTTGQKCFCVVFCLFLVSSLVRLFLPNIAPTFGDLLFVPLTCYTDAGRPSIGWVRGLFNQMELLSGARSAKPPEKKCQPPYNLI